MVSGAWMKIFAVLVCFLVSFLSPWRLCFGDELKVEAEVVGLVDCFDCAVKKVFPREAFSGIRVAIDCKGADQLFKTRGDGFLNGEGEFWVSLPNEMLLKNGTLMEECFAHLHSASARLCPPLNGVEATRIVLKSKIDDKYTFGPAGELKLSPAICASAFLQPHFRHRNIPWYPPGSKLPLFAKHHYALSDYVPHPWKKKEKPLLPKIPIFRKPLPRTLPAPVPLAQKLHPAPALRHGMPAKERGSMVAPVVRKAFPNLPVPKRLHPTGKHYPLHRLRLPIPRIGDMSHP